MAYEPMNFNQVGALLNGIYQQATGQGPIAVNNTADFVAVAEATLRVGYDPVMQAISQMIGRTIFAVRPYNRKFGELVVSDAEFGNQVRKITPVANDFLEKDVAYSPEDLANGQTVDMYEIRQAPTYQTNFYGSAVWSDYYTRFLYQLKSAFSNPDELARFWASIATEMMNKREQAIESFSRATVANYIAGIVASNPDGGVIHLLTEYNTVTGQSYTKNEIYMPDNFRAFIQWANARILQVSAMMTERSTLFHASPSGKTILRHTSPENQRAYIYAPAKYQIESMAFANTFNDGYVKRIVNGETVNYWQSIDIPDQIKVKPAYFDLETGGRKEGDEVTVDNVFGFIADRDAIGVNLCDQWNSVTPVNSRGGYYNDFYHMRRRFWNDFTENGVVFLLD